MAAEQQPEGSCSENLKSVDGFLGMKAAVCPWGTGWDGCWYIRAEVECRRLAFDGHQKESCSDLVFTLVAS